MTLEIIQTKSEAAQNELQKSMNELTAVQKHSDELNMKIHNLKVQIATYQDLLADNADEVTSEVRETVESLVADE